MLSAVLFDLDDTLHDRAGSLRTFLKDQHRRWLAGFVHQDRFIDLFMKLDANGSLPKAVLYPRLLDQLGIAGVSPAALNDDYGVRFHDFAQAKDDAEDVLKQLRHRGLKLGIISNGWTEFQLRTLDAIGLTNAVDLIFISEAEGLRKPDQRLFERAADRLGCAVSECLFVGDNPLADIDSAGRSGMQTAWIMGTFAWPGDLKPADRQIETLRELLAFVPAGIK
jgi:putative hydrolase of the HAD superfamily